MSTNLTVSVVQVAIIAPSTLAWLVTTVRLIDRKVYRRLWWDEAFAALSMISLILVFAAYWSRNAPAFPESRSLRLGLYFVLALGFPSAVWMARYSILFTVIRVAPTENAQRLLFGVAAAFGVCYVILFAQVFWTCLANPDGWMQDDVNTQCPLGREVAIAQLITDILSDVTLISIPIYLLRRASIREGSRIRLVAVFTSSIFISFVSLVHAAFILEDDPVKEALLAFIEMSVSLLVCNIAVIVTIVMRYLKLALDLDDYNRHVPRQTFTTFNTTRLGELFHFTRLREEIAFQEMTVATAATNDATGSISHKSDVIYAAGTSALDLEAASSVASYHVVILSSAPAVMNLVSKKWHIQKT
ncbi:hypothetical protein DACRYDRAFT_109529 [Dacryopinax primogenitus]|uniref:Rhodopsin domain-containing protein n=1 Tax=Dacryopinax primogenitus (strain DJM 731) TaxID=1858805 RepID=M5FV28_DACPD|nr:uncharacterized protein DACRYDRAFT_109529 [Dacryopinax primogenitus]EJU00109.1 hypothetical protein DACRYDRAFT_109529 [Dacryopinax primogenitus]